MNWLKERHREPEIQDQLDLEPKRLHGALAGLQRINYWSGAHRLLWPAIRDLARHDAARRLSVLDLASGAGDIPIALWRRARRAGIELDIAGCDFNPRAVAFAEELAQRKQVPVSYFTWDVLEKDPPHRFDVATCSLFMHHLDEAQAVMLLERMTRTAKRLVVVSDLQRCARGLALAYVVTRLLATSRVNRVDSVRSVRAAFSLAEARELACRAGLADATLTPRWPCRFVLTWRRHAAKLNDAQSIIPRPEVGPSLRKGQ